MKTLHQSIGVCALATLYINPGQLYIGIVKLHTSVANLWRNFTRPSFSEQSNKSLHKPSNPNLSADVK